MVIYIIIGIVVVLLLYVFVNYNQFIKLTNLIHEAFATMDVYLKKRWDLIPNLVETVKGYAEHEKDTLTKVIALRNCTYDQLVDDDKLETNEQLTSGIQKIMALAEAYPDLKANQNFLNLSTQLTEVEDEIAESRKYYNAVVRMYNNKVEMFPSNLIASLFGYHTKKMFEASDAERKNVKVKL